MHGLGNRIGHGCQLVFLPPYSPDLNPIEHYWHKLKLDDQSFNVWLSHSSMPPFDCWMNLAQRYLVFYGWDAFSKGIIAQGYQPDF